MLILPRRIGLLVTFLGTLILPALAVAQEQLVPCDGVPLNCIDSINPSAPDANKARNAVVRLLGTGRYTDTNEAFSYCGTGFLVPNTYTINGQTCSTIVTAGHVLAGVSSGRPYVAVGIKAEFFYTPKPARVCGTLGSDECWAHPNTCATPVAVTASCWEKDPRGYDLGRIFVPTGLVPAGAAPLTLAGAIAVSMPVWIPGHPLGRCMEWSQHAIGNLYGSTFTYNVSTEGGSSGSPVLLKDFGNTVAGVHVGTYAGNVCPNEAVNVNTLSQFLALAPPQKCIPTMSEWGLLVLGLLTLTSGTLVMRRAAVL